MAEINEIGKSLEEKGKKLEEMKRKGKEFDEDYMDLQMNFLMMAKSVKQVIKEKEASHINVGMKIDEEKAVKELIEALNIKYRINGKIVNASQIKSIEE